MNAPSSATLPPVAFLGAGQMAEAILRGLLDAHLVTPDAVWVTNRDQAKADKLAYHLSVQVAPGNREAVRGPAELVLLCMKPLDVPSVLDEIARDLRPNQLVVSIVAGLTLATLERQLPELRVIRAMPNTPALVRNGMTVISGGSRATGQDEALVLQLFGAVGRALPLPEKYLDAVTALSASGPAFLSVVAEALTDAGVRLGLSRAIALQLVAQTVLGTGALLQREGAHPALLKDAVASPGGTTMAGLHAMERAGVRGGLMDAVIAAADHATVLGESARTQSA